MNRNSKIAVALLALATTAAPMMAQAQDRSHGGNGRYETRYDNRGPDRGHDRYQPRGPEMHPGGHNRPNGNHMRPPPPPSRWARSERDWWRGRADFRDYRGARANHWYAPGYGYYRVEPRYYGQQWRRGGYLPSAYRSYYVRDPDFYGLRPAPRGYGYVYAGNDIVLIALATGLITNVLSGIY